MVNACFVCGLENHICPLKQIELNGANAEKTKVFVCVDGPCEGILRKKPVATEDFIQGNGQ
jgi:hypothetical protein